ncbi:hypothetical protein HOG21_01420 [bacterium]|jgi:hypothetical protein|nr:hypothetical protein [bacterium]
MLILLLSFTNVDINIILLNITSSYFIYFTVFCKYFSKKDILYRISYIFFLKKLGTSKSSLSGFLGGFTDGVILESVTGFLPK